MRVSNEPDEDKGGAWSELIRLQSDFYSRLTEETLRYLRRLQGASMPVSPGTVVLPDPNTSLAGAGKPGDTIRLTIEVENRQRVHCMVTPMLSPLVHTAGATWFPGVRFERPSVLIPPDQVETIAIEIAVPAEIPKGMFRGMLLLQGLRDNTIPIALEIGGEPPPARPEPPAKPGRPKRPPVKAARKRGTGKS